MEESSQELYNTFIPTGIGFIIEGIEGTHQGTPLKTVLLQTDLNMVMQFCYLFDALLPPLERMEAVEYSSDVLECIFIEVCMLA